VRDLRRLGTKPWGHTAVRKPFPSRPVPRCKVEPNTLIAIFRGISSKDLSIVTLRVRHWDSTFTIVTPTRSRASRSSSSFHAFVCLGCCWGVGCWVGVCGWGFLWLGGVLVCLGGVGFVFPCGFFRRSFMSASFFNVFAPPGPSARSLFSPPFARSSREGIFSRSAFPLIAPPARPRAQEGFPSGSVFFFLAGRRFTYDFPI